MKKYLLQFILSLSLPAVTDYALAQAPGSVETIGGTIGVDVYSSSPGNTTASAAETLYMGPGNYEIDGTWEIYSKNIWISPDAVITGTGTIKFFNPSVAGGAASATLIDGNNNASFINVNIELQNAGNMVLTEIAGPGSPWTDVTGNANLTSGKVFNFTVTNGDLILGNNDMITATAATLIGYLPTQFVVTNGTGHLVHNNYTGAFTYPVGIAEGDYTPASVNNSTVNTIHVQVQDYATSASVETGTNGIGRTWNIYADNASANSLIDLQHNNITNQASYNDGVSFVTQYGPTTPNTTGQTTLSQTAWQSNNQIPGGTGTGTLTTGAAIVTASERSLTYSTLATSASSATAFFSKSSDPVHTLPLILLGFTGQVTNCAAVLKWNTAEESDINRFELQSSTNGSVFIPVAQIVAKGSYSSYTYTDNNISSAGLLYRLRIIDINGVVTYSEIVALNINCNDLLIKVYPNPVKDRVTISGLAAKSGLRLTDAMGQVLINITAANTTQDIDMSKLARGTYLLQVIQDNKIVKSIKLIKK